MKQLNEEQRKFLVYLQKEYLCLGYDISIPDILKINKYSPQTMSEIIAEWKLFRVGQYSRINSIKALYESKKPKQYLNG